jgi:hypothetical protein
MQLPPLPPLEEVRARLERIFPEGFPDRTILIGEMAARVIYVALYGGFVTGKSVFFRPSTVIRFSFDQATKRSDSERVTWLGACHAPGYKTIGQQWYADNTREPVRDDYIRNRAVPMGFIDKREGFATTSPAPIYSLDPDFAELFALELSDDALSELIDGWRDRNLDPMVLKRMRLAASGIFEREGDVTVTLPSTGQVLRLSAGDAALITKDAVEILAPTIMVRPVVIHLSMSDVKMRPELAANAKALGLEIDPREELPDVIIANVPKRGPLTLFFVEVVHSDGVITELRKKALLEIARKAGIPETHVCMITAFNDRSATVFKKRFSELAQGSRFWFRTEPHLLMRIDRIGEEQAA